VVRAASWNTRAMSRYLGSTPPSGLGLGVSFSRLSHILCVGLLLLCAWLPLCTGAGGDCMSGNEIECFDCNTWEDERCNDPWNWTYPLENMPPMKTCEGCCVKMVQFIGTEHYQIKRTCTDDFEVNFFMVNHACMTEGHRHGHMCFCEEDKCNAAPVLSLSHLSFLPALLLALLHLFLPAR